MRTFSLGELFTRDEIALAIELGDNPDLIEAQVVIPAMARITELTGQVNDSRYITYMFIAALFVMAGLEANKRRD